MFFFPKYHVLKTAILYYKFVNFQSDNMPSSLHPSHSMSSPLERRDGFPPMPEFDRRIDRRFSDFPTTPGAVRRTFRLAIFLLVLLVVMWKTAEQGAIRVLACLSLRWYFFYLKWCASIHCLFSFDVC